MNPYAGGAGSTDPRIRPPPVGEPVRRRSDSPTKPRSDGGRERRVYTSPEPGQILGDRAAEPRRPVSRGGTDRAVSPSTSAGQGHRNKRRRYDSRGSTPDSGTYDGNGGPPYPGLREREREDRDRDRDREDRDRNLDRERDRDGNKMRAWRRDDYAQAGRRPDPRRRSRSRSRSPREAKRRDAGDGAGFVKAGEGKDAVLPALEEFIASILSALQAQTVRSVAFAHLNRLQSLPFPAPSTGAAESLTSALSNASKAVDDATVDFVRKRTLFSRAVTELLKRIIARPGVAEGDVKALDGLQLGEVIERLDRLESKTISSLAPGLRAVPEPPVEPGALPPPPPTREGDGGTTARPSFVPQRYQQPSAASPLPSSAPPSAPTAPRGAPSGPRDTSSSDEKKSRARALLEDVLSRLSVVEGLKEWLEQRCDELEDQMWIAVGDRMSRRALLGPPPVKRRTEATFGAAEDEAVSGDGGWGALENERDPEGVLRGIDVTSVGQGEERQTIGNEGQGQDEGMEVTPAVADPLSTGSPSRGQTALKPEETSAPSVPSATSGPAASASAGAPAGPTGSDQTEEIQRLRKEVATMRAQMEWVTQQMENMKKKAESERAAVIEAAKQALTKTAEKEIPELAKQEVQNAVNDLARKMKPVPSTSNNGGTTSKNPSASSPIVPPGQLGAPSQLASQPTARQPGPLTHSSLQTLPSSNPIIQSGQIHFEPHPAAQFQQAYANALHLQQSNRAKQAHPAQSYSNTDQPRHFLQQPPRPPQLPPSTTSGTYPPQPYHSSGSMDQGAILRRSSSGGANGQRSSANTDTASAAPVNATAMAGFGPAFAPPSLTPPLPTYASGSAGQPARQPGTTLGAPGQARPGISSGGAMGRGGPGWEFQDDGTVIIMMQTGQKAQMTLEQAKQMAEVWGKAGYMPGGANPEPGSTGGAKPT